MTAQFKVKVIRETSEMLQKLAFKAGFTWTDDTGKVFHPKGLESYFLHFTCTHQFYFSVASDIDYELLSLDLAVEELTASKKLMVLGYEVEKMSDGVKLGCKIVSKKTVDDINKVIDNGEIKVGDDTVRFRFDQSKIRIGEYFVTFDECRKIKEFMDSK